MLDRLAENRKDSHYQTAMVCATIANTHCDFEKRPEGFSPEDFMPGAKANGRHSLEQFALECEANGYTHAPTEQDKELAASFVAQMEKTFKNVNEVGKVTQVKD